MNKHMKKVQNLIHRLYFHVQNQPEDNNDSRELIINDNSSNVSNQLNLSHDNLFIKKSFCENNIVNSTNQKIVKKTSFPVKVSSLHKFKKTNDIVLIDLTCDGVTEKILRKKKTRRKLNWLEEAKKRIGTKINVKKIQDSSIEDETEEIALQPEDSLNFDSLRIASRPKSIITDMEIIVDRVEADNKTSTSEISSETPSIMKNDKISTVTNLPDAFINNKAHYCKVELNDLENRENEKNQAEIIDTEKFEKKIAASIQMETSSTLTETTRFDESLRVNNINENMMREKVGEMGTLVVDMPSEALYEDITKVIKDKTVVAHSAPVRQAIKAEHVTEEPNEIINEVTVSSDDGIKVTVVEYTSEPRMPQTTCENAEELSTSKIGNGEFQENIDGLSLLASVSQSVSHLTNNRKVNELIKVKNYASLVDLNATVISEPGMSSSDAIVPFCGVNSTSEIINRIVGIHPEDAMEKVAYQIEVTSTDENLLNYEISDEINRLVEFSNNDETCCNSQTQSSNLVPVENTTGTTMPTTTTTTQSEKDDTNVILNGETVVLFQKSPNSNLYIINKAVENRGDHTDEVSMNPHREMADHINETGPLFSYDIYDNRYRNKAPSYDISPQYNRELSTQVEARRGNKSIKVDSTVDTNNDCDNSLELGKKGKNNKKSLNVDKTRIKRNKSATRSTSLSRRRHIKQEYNGCSSQSHNTNRIKSNYGMKDCPQDHVDSTRSIHIPVSHSSPLSSIYTKYTAGPELYLPCHKNCNSMTCGLPVNPPTSLHSHSGKNSSSGNSHCSCLNCAYEIVTHCGECHQLPNGETRINTIDQNSYYLPLHSSVVKNTNVQDCNRTSIDDSLSKIYDNQLVCKFQQSIVDGRELENHGVKYEPKDIYRADLDNKLPLKKRFKAIMAMSFDEMPIKREKKDVESYPGTPMLSIATLEAAAASAAATQNDTKMMANALGNCDNHSLDDLDEKFTTNDNEENFHQSREMIRRDYRKDIIMSPPPAPSLQTNGYHRNEPERKRKSRLPSNTMSCGLLDGTNLDGSNCENIKKTANLKHRETIIVEAVGSKRTTTTTTTTKAHVSPLAQVKEQEFAQCKNSTRQTRSSKRNVPKVNYIYTDGDSDCNPSGGGGGGGGSGVGGSKRKRRKTSR